MKRICSVLILFFAAVSIFAFDVVESAVPEKKSYVTYLTPYDFGAVADKLVINTGISIKAENISAEDFEVEMKSMDSSRSDSTLGFSKGERKVEKAYLSDETGLPSIETTGKYITLKLEVKPEESSDSSLIDFYVLKMDSFYGFEIENSKLDISINRQTAVVCPEAAKFKTSKFTWIDSAEDSTDEITMNYATWLPENKADEKIPLIVFFHGIAESGNDIYKPLLGIKGVALADKKIQSHFKNGAAVLIPQCPTGWLEITDKDPFGNRLWAVVDIKGKTHDVVSKVTNPVNNFFKRVFSSPIYEDSYTSSVKTPVSYYSKAAKELIDKVIAENPQIDVSRIYVGGCSAGGFMTVNMMIQYTDFFAAAFPICEAFPDDRINDKDIKKLAEKPMWFTVAKNDETINPEKNTIPTVKRLEEADAKNLHHVYFDDVHDTSGQFFMESEDDDDDKTSDSTKKLPYQYSGHESWIYVLNDEVNEGSLNLFDWLAGQSNGN